jgi:hypothetical protein
VVFPEVARRATGVAAVLAAVGLAAAIPAVDWVVEDLAGVAVLGAAGLVVAVGHRVVADCRGV